MDEITLKNLQQVEFEMLCDIDKYCRKYRIKYSLYAGTMLGAVRHEGFIPWDDDVDICMTRKEYTRFTHIIKKYPMEGYYFQDFETDNNCMMNHGKVRKNGTILLSEGENKENGHHGIWIDIFPLDKISNNKVKVFKTTVFGKIIVLLTRANQLLVSNDIKKVVVNRLIRLIPGFCRHKILLFCARRIRIYDKRIVDDFTWTSMSALENFNLRFPREMVCKYTLIKFNGKSFICFKNYKEMLRILYGDYMLLPPKSERVCKHNPIEIKF